MNTNKDDEINAVPAGSLPLEDNSDNQTAGAPAQDQPQTPSLPEKFQGKTAEEIAKAYEDLEKDHGRLGTEVGSLRKSQEITTKQQELLLNQLATLQNQGQQAQGGGKNGAPDFDAQINDLTAKVESGDIDIASALRQTVELTDRKASFVTDQKISEFATRQSAESIKDKFVGSNPDFLELQRTGQLDGIKSENPMHDDFSAFHEYKRREVLAQVDAREKEAFAKGRDEGSRLAQGADAAGRVLGKNGGNVRPGGAGQMPRNDTERAEGMLDVLKKVRGQT